MVLGSPFISFVEWIRIQEKMDAAEKLLAV